MFDMHGTAAHERLSLDAVERALEAYRDAKSAIDYRRRHSGGMSATSDSVGSEGPEHGGTTEWEHEQQIRLARDRKLAEHFDPKRIPDDLADAYEHVNLTVIRGGSALPNAVRKKHARQSYTRIGWQDASLLCAYSDSTSKLVRWCLDYASSGVDGRLQRLPDAKYSKDALPKLTASGVAMGCRIAIDAQTITMDLGDGRVASFTHEEAIRGYVQNPYALDLFAAIDAEGQVLVLRLHK
jgi:hypothetical protein